MKEARYFYVPNAGAKSELPPDEALHAVRVLRLKDGDEIFLIDGEGTFYKAKVTLPTAKRCGYDIVETLPQEKGWHGNIRLAVAPTKMMERMEWLVEKATEVGFDEVSFLNCRFSERQTVRCDRIEKIVVSAMKQSRKPWKPVVNALQDFKAFVAQPRTGRKFIAHCYKEIARKDFFSLLMEDDMRGGIGDITVMVGPEGDFSTDEVRLAMEHGYESITLGDFRLRTETAALAAVMMAQLSRRKENKE
jgi:16S rRNA (uracil1498-N3)-methyltransferase